MPKIDISPAATLEQSAIAKLRTELETNSDITKEEAEKIANHVYINSDRIQQRRLEVKFTKIALDPSVTHEIVVGAMKRL